MMDCGQSLSPANQICYDSPVGALDHKEVFLYSDLLLHDLGPTNEDMCLGDASPTEFRTEMLMGLRFRQRFRLNSAG